MPTSSPLLARPADTANAAAQATHHEHANEPAPAELPAWQDIPVFIINRNRLSALQRLVDWVLAAGTRRVVILDNASTYPPLLHYYEHLPEGAKVLLMPDNHGPYVLWEQGVHRNLDTPYVVTDSDVVPADFCPKDLIGRLLHQLQRFPDAKKVGMALRIDNLPDSYIDADTVRKWESQFWEHPVAPGVFAAPVDTTFAIYPARGEFSNAPCNLRLGYPCIAEHTPWYCDEAALGAEERYYRDHTSPIFSNWSVAKKDSWVRKSDRVAAFAQRAQVLHIDGGREYIPGWINAGSGSENDSGHFDIAFDPQHSRRQALPLADNTVDGIHLSHVLEGVRDAQALFDELYRVARPNAKLFIRVAHGARADAWQGSHLQRAWTEGSFAHFAQPSQAPDAGYRGDWQLESVQLVVAPAYPGGLADVLAAPGPVRELIATLRAIKPGRERRGRHPAPQVEPVLVRDARVDPAFAIASAQPSPVAQQPVQLGLPWRMPHYGPLNGAHPLVVSFVQGNPAVRAIELMAGASASAAQQNAVVQRLTEQARPLAPEATGAFIEWLKVADQFAIEAQASNCDALFLHTTPLYAGTRPWIFHFESFPSLFMPFMFTGDTTGVDLRQQGFYAQVRAALESPLCLRIVSHLRGSLAILNRVFDSPTIARKCHHVPLGIPTEAPAAALAKFDQGKRLRILFTNSLHRNPHSFYLRGGHHLLEAFARLRKRLPDAELTVLSSVPADLEERFPVSQRAGVNWLSAHADDNTLRRLFLGHHLFALPAAGLHSHSLLRALAHGCVPIVSDAPGYEEFTHGIEDSVLTVRGVRDLVYRDEASGWISDRYAAFTARSASFVAQLHDGVLAHADMPRLREMAARNLDHCRQQFSPAASHAAFNHVLALQ